MDQKKLWEKKWKDRREQFSPNNFAIRAHKFIGKSHRKLLDLGCGNGHDSLYFAQNGLQVTAVDWSKDCLDQLIELSKKKDVKIEVIRQSIPQLKIKDNSMDIIYAHLSLHYFDNETTESIFNKIYEALRKNGLFFLKCKSIDDELYGKGRKLENNMYVFKNHVRHFFDKNYMAIQLKKFQIIKMRRTSSAYHNHKSSFIEAIAKK